MVQRLKFVALHLSVVWAGYISKMIFKEVKMKKAFISGIDFLEVSLWSFWLLIVFCLGCLLWLDYKDTEQDMQFLRQCMSEFHADKNS